MLQQQDRVGRKHVVMIVEDDRTLRELLLDYLTDVGFDIVEASSGDEAQELFPREKRIELVLTDINMPGHVDGAELARWLSHCEPDLPVILMSGRGINPVRTSETRRFLMKPYEFSEVERQIREMLLVRA